MRNVGRSSSGTSGRIETNLDINENIESTTGDMNIQEAARVSIGSPVAVNTTMKELFADLSLASVSYENEEEIDYGSIVNINTTSPGKTMMDLRTGDSVAQNPITLDVVSDIILPIENAKRYEDLKREEYNLFGEISSDSECENEEKGKSALCSNERGAQNTNKQDVDSDAIPSGEIAKTYEDLKEEERNLFGEISSDSASENMSSDYDVDSGNEEDKIIGSASDSKKVVPDSKNYDSVSVPQRRKEPVESSRSEYKSGNENQQNNIYEEIYNQFASSNGPCGLNDDGEAVPQNQQVQTSENNKDTTVPTMVAVENQFDAAVITDRHDKNSIIGNDEEVESGDDDPFLPNTKKTSRYRRIIDSSDDDDSPGQDINSNSVTEKEKHDHQTPVPKKKKPNRMKNAARDKFETIPNNNDRKQDSNDVKKKRTYTKKRPDSKTKIENENLQLEKITNSREQKNSKSTVKQIKSDSKPTTKKINIISVQKNSKSTAKLRKEQVEVTKENDEGIKEKVNAKRTKISKNSGKQDIREEVHKKRIETDEDNGNSMETQHSPLHNSPNEYGKSLVPHNQKSSTPTEAYSGNNTSLKAPSLSKLDAVHENVSVPSKITAPTKLNELDNEIEVAEEKVKRLQEFVTNLRAKKKRCLEEKEKNLPRSEKRQKLLSQKKKFEQVIRFLNDKKLKEEKVMESLIDFPHLIMSMNNK